MDIYFKVNERVNGYTILKVLGEGRFGIAYLAMNDRNQKCVVKQLKREMLEKSREKLFYEEQILRRLNNPRFPKFISKFKDAYREGYLLEYMDGYVFDDLIGNNRYRMSKDKIYMICSQLLDLVEILHNNNIVHRDIRLPNVIIRENKELALIDFGLARFIDNERYTKETDYWYIGDFLIYLYYSTYKSIRLSERPWYEELDMNYEERKFIKRLMGIDGRYHNMVDIRAQFEKIKNIR
jgi:serine/threonine protein kinase